MKHSIQTNPSQANAYPEPCRGSRVTPQTARKEASRYPSNWSESKTLSNKWGEGVTASASTEKHCGHLLSLALNSTINQPRPKTASTAHGTT